MRLLNNRSSQARSLDSIKALCRESMRIEKTLTEAVLAARESGHTWTEIGQSLGSTKQAAWRRFARGPMAARFEGVAARAERPRQDE